VSGQFRVPAALLPGKEPPVHIEWKAWCALEPVWARRRRGKSLSRAGNRKPAVQTVARRYTDVAIPALVLD
jgi:hypothetical protein